MKLLRIDDTTINLDHVIRVERGLGYLEVYFDLLDPICNWLVGAAIVSP